MTYTGIFLIYSDEEEDFILVSSDDELVEIMKEHTKLKDVTKADGEHLKLYIRGMYLCV